MHENVFRSLTFGTQVLKIVVIVFTTIFYSFCSSRTTWIIHSLGIPKPPPPIVILGVLGRAGQWGAGGLGRGGEGGFPSLFLSPPR